jgi:alkanesulfonate monooxygenase SsuD/methylene tetrahydromethanopterin reductase-like flavin-dependent oxidoreductase (luciferase family)
LRPKIDNIRKLAKLAGRNPQDVKFFTTFTPILGRTDEEAFEKKERFQKYNSLAGGLVLFSGITGIDASKLDLDEPLVKSQSKAGGKVTSHLDTVSKDRGKGNEMTPRKVGESLAGGGISPLTIGSPSTVADEMERWMEIGDLDGFNIAEIVSPGSFTDVVDLLIPELVKRGLYPETIENGLTGRERIYGKGHNHLLPEHAGSKFKYDVYKESST